MSQQQSVEAARVRIQRLVEEIAQLSKGDMRSEEFYQQFLSRSVQACDAKGGAVWIVGQRTAEGKSEFQLAASVELEASLFQTDENQRGVLLRALAEVVQSKKPLVLSAEGGGAAPGSLQAQLAPQPSPNKTPYPFVHVPLFLKEQVLGVLQIWLQPYVTRENYGEFATFLSQLAANVEQHFQSRRMGTMLVENQRLQHLLKFTSDMTGTLEPVEVARLASNYGRDLLGCERCAVLRFRGGSWDALSISGQEVVEKKSTMVKGVVAFVAAHTPHVPQEFTPEGAATVETKPWILALSKKELLAISDTGATAAIVDESRSRYLRPHGPTDIADAAFFEDSQVLSALIVQLLDSDKHVVGALLAESTAEGFFDIPPGAKDAPSHRLAEWMAGNTGRALKAASDHRELPFLFATKRLREVKRGVTGTHRGRYIFKRVVWLAIILGTLLFPWMREVESDCTLVPKKRVKVVPEIQGRLEKVFVREGNMVKKGDPLARQDTSALDTEFKHTMQEMLAAVAEVEKARGTRDSAGVQIATTKVEAADERMKRLKQDIEAGTIRAPIDGVVMTKDIELLEKVLLTPGADFCIIGTTDDWDVQVHLHEKEIGKIENLLSKGPIDVKFILYSQNQSQLNGRFSDKSQLSQVAYPHERENAIRENAFILTLSDVQAPDDVRRGFRPDLTGRASIQLGRTPVIVIWAKNVAEWIRLKWVW